MVRSIVKKVMWVGRATVFLVGLSVILAIMFAVASMAFADNGEPFLLGRLANSTTALTKLTGNVDGSALQVVNNNAGPDDTALNLSVQSGEAPMEVSSATKVARLNADRLDGKDSSQLLSNNTYVNPVQTTGLDVSGTRLFTVACDEGDKLLSGGFREFDVGTTLVSSFPGRSGSDPHWTVEWKNDGTADTVILFAYCSDFAPAHT